jgi:hypothetical protein
MTQLRHRGRRSTSRRRLSGRVPGHTQYIRGSVPLTSSKSLDWTHLLLAVGPHLVELLHVLGQLASVLPPPLAHGPPDQLLQLAYVLIVVVQETQSRPPISACPARLLIVSDTTTRKLCQGHILRRPQPRVVSSPFHRLGHGRMHDEAAVWVVNPHPVGDGGAHHADLAGLPRRLHRPPLRLVLPCAHTQPCPVTTCLTGAGTTLKPHRRDRSPLHRTTQGGRDGKGGSAHRGPWNPALGLPWMPFSRRKSDKRSVSFLVMQ